MIERKSLLTMLGERRNKVAELRREIEFAQMVIYLQQLRLDKMKDIIKHPNRYLKNGSV